MTEIENLKSQLEIATKALTELGHHGIDFGYGKYECNVAQIAQDALSKIKELDK